MGWGKEGRGEEMNGLLDENSFSAVYHMVELSAFPEHLFIPE